MFVKIKRLRLLVIATTGFLLVLPGAVFAASNSLSLTTPITTLTTGTEFNVTLKVDSTPSILGVSTDVKFNASQLAYVSYSTYATSFPDLYGQTADTGIISSTRGVAGSGVSGNRVIVTYRFKVLAAGGQSTIGVTGLANANSVELPLTRGVLTLNITPSGSAITNSSTGSSSAGNSTGANTGTDTNANTLATAPGTSVDVRADTAEQSTNTTEPKAKGGALGIFSANNPLVNSSPKSIRLAVAFGSFVLIIALSGGIWFFINRRKSKQVATHFPDLHATLFTDTSRVANTAVAPLNTPQGEVSQEFPATDSVQSAPSTTYQQPTPSVVDPVVIQPQIVQPTPQPPVNYATPPNTSPQAVVMPQGGTINPDEIKRVG